MPMTECSLLHLGEEISVIVLYRAENTGGGYFILDPGVSETSAVLETVQMC